MGNYLRGVVVCAVVNDVLSTGFRSGQAWVWMQDESGTRDLRCAVYD